MEEVEVTTIAGSIKEDKDGIGSEACFNFPYGVAVRSDGSIIVSDIMNHKIKMIDVKDNVITIAGSTPGDKDGIGSEACFNFPYGVAVRSDGSIIVTDFENHKIKMIDEYGNVTTLAGSVIGDKDGIGSEAFFNQAFGVAVRSDGSIIVSDSGNHKIKMIDINDKVTTIAGSIKGDKDGIGSEACFNYPEGVAVRSDGSIIVSDTFNHKIKMIDVNDNVITLAGSIPGNKNGIGSEACFNYPRGVAVRSEDLLL